MALDMDSLLPAVNRQRRPLIITLATVLLLRSRLLQLLSKDIYAKLYGSTSKHNLSSEELAQALQQLYVKEADGSKTLLVPYREGISQVRSLVHLVV